MSTIDLENGTRILSPNSGMTISDTPGINVKEIVVSKKLFDDKMVLTLQNGKTLTLRWENKE